MPDPSEQLQRLAEAGFGLETRERYPTAVAAVRGECVALLEVTQTGLRLIGTPGWRMGELMGVLIEKGGRQVFQAKSEVVDATPERRRMLKEFRSELERALTPTA